MQDWSEEGEAGQYSPGTSSALTQVEPFSVSLYTVLHSVIYNSVGGSKKHQTKTNKKSQKHSYKKRNKKNKMLKNSKKNQNNIII